MRNRMPTELVVSGAGSLVVNGSFATLQRMLITSAGLNVAGIDLRDGRSLVGSIAVSGFALDGYWTRSYQSVMTGPLIGFGNVRDQIALEDSSTMFVAAGAGNTIAGMSAGRNGNRVANGSAIQNSGATQILGSGNANRGIELFSGSEINVNLIQTASNGAQGILSARSDIICNEMQSFGNNAAGIGRGLYVEGGTVKGHRDIDVRQQHRRRDLCRRERLYRYRRRRSWREWRVRRDGSHHRPARHDQQGHALPRRRRPWKLQCNQQDGVIMKQIVILNGQPVAVHEPGQDLGDAYPAPHIAVRMDASSVTSDGGVMAWAAGVDAADVAVARRAAMTLSPSQLAIMLMKNGTITPAQAEQFAAAGVIPATLMSQINDALDASPLTAEEKAIARIRVRGALEYRRLDPATPIIGAALGLNDEALDALFVAGMSH